MKNLFTLLLITLGLTSCSSVNYMGKEQLVNLFGEEADDDQINYINFGHSKSVKNLGAIAITRFDTEGNATDEPMVLNLKRMKSQVYAETSLFASDNFDKSFFDEGLMRFGLDKDNKGMSFGLTLKF